MKRTIIAICALFSLCAMAQPQTDKQPESAGERRAPELAKLDSDGDGALSRAEARTREQLLVDFDRIDLDRDDKLERAEYASFYSAGYRAAN